MKHQEPNIQKLAKSYNKLCTELSQLIQAGQAPDGVLPPHPIDMDHLFALDVDDDIWQDIRLDETDTTMSVLRWMCDENV